VIMGTPLLSVLPDLFPLSSVAYWRIDAEFARRCERAAVFRNWQLRQRPVRWSGSSDTRDVDADDLHMFQDRLEIGGM